jgi:Skp family chaperone for outer membrane proteins
MPVSIKQHFKHAPTQESIEFKRVMNAVQADLAALRASIVAITAQLDADGGITDTDYAANNDPAALTLIS